MRTLKWSAISPPGIGCRPKAKALGFVVHGWWTLKVQIFRETFIWEHAAKHIEVVDRVGGTFVS